MLARARRAAGASGVALELVDADILGGPLPGAGAYRLAILALNSILLFPDAEGQARVVAAMARLVGAGGLVVIDAWQPQPIDLVNLDGRLSLEWLRADP